MLRYLKLSVIDLLLGYLTISIGATLRSFFVDSQNIVDSLSSFLYITYLPLLFFSFATLVIFAFLNGLFFIKKIKSNIFLILFFQSLVILTIIKSYMFCYKFYIKNFYKNCIIEFLYEIYFTFLKHEFILNIII